MSSATRAPIPSPRAPRLVQTAHWVRRPYRYMEECQARFGDVFLLRLYGFGDTVLVADIELARAIMRMEPRVAAGEANAIMEPVVGPESLFVLDDEAHRERRTLLRRAVHASMTDSMIEVAACAVADAIAEDVVAVPLAMRTVTLQVMGEWLLGTSKLSDLGPLQRELDWVVGPGGAVLAFAPALQREDGPLWPGWWLRRRLRRADEHLARLASTERACVAKHLADAAACTHMPASNRDDLVTLLLAGVDTTASAISWALHWLAKSPTTQKRLVESIRAGQSEPHPASLLSNSLLRSICLESMRLSPVVESVIRRTREPILLGRFEVPAGTVLAPATYLLHRDPQLYPEPDRFVPDRFVDSDVGASFLAFGGGRRRCLGAGVALEVVQLVVGLVVTQRHFSPQRRRDAEFRAPRRNVTIGPPESFAIATMPRSSRPCTRREGTA